MSFRRGIHATAPVAARLSPMVTRISRMANQRNMAKIQLLKDKLGQKYSVIGRDKRKSPITERTSASTPTQPKKPTTIKGSLNKLFITESNLKPDNLVPGAGLLALKRMSFKGQSKAAEVSVGENQGSINMPAQGILKTKEVQDNSNTVMQLREDRTSKPLFKDGFEIQSAKGPFYQHSLMPSEQAFLLEETPKVLEGTYRSAALDFEGQQAEMVRRIISIESGNAQARRKLNVARVVEHFQNDPKDTGSSQVQAAVMTIKIRAMEQHLAKHHKDKSTKRKLELWNSKRTKMLKYLRRKDLKLFVMTANKIGVDPKLFDTI